MQEQKHSTSDQKNVLFVSDLDERCSQEELESFFSEYSPTTRTQMRDLKSEVWLASRSQSVRKDIHDDELEEIRFRLSSFLNETLIYNKDKEGFNTSILIFQAMLLLLEGNFRKLVDKTEALKRYGNRYFIKDAIYKSQIFIKMLLIADKCSYDRTLTTQKTDKYFEKLKTTGYEHVNSYDGLEIVPYSDLWEIALERMKE